jgi:hypothetical protein
MDIEQEAHNNTGSKNRPKPSEVSSPRDEDSRESSDSSASSTEDYMVYNRHGRRRSEATDPDTDEERLKKENELQESTREWQTADLDDDQSSSTRYSTFETEIHRGTKAQLDTQAAVEDEEAQSSQEEDAMSYKTIDSNDTTHEQYEQRHSKEHINSSTQAEETTHSSPKLEHLGTTQDKQTTKPAGILKKYPQQAQQAESAPTSPPNLHAQ